MARRNEAWKDITQLGSPWEVQYQPATGRHRHRPNPLYDPAPLGTRRPPVEWRNGPPPERGGFP